MYNNIIYKHKLFFLNIRLNNKYNFIFEQYKIY